MSIVPENVRLLVEARIAALVEKVEASTKKRIEVAEIMYNPSMGAIAGRAFLRTKRIELNSTILMANLNDFIRTTVAHEYAHIVTNVIFPNAKQAHGPEFKRVMNFLGVEPNTYHNYDVTKVRPAKAGDVRMTCCCKAICGSPKVHTIGARKYANAVRVNRPGASLFFCKICKADLVKIK